MKTTIRRQAGNVRLGCFFIAIIGALFWVGGQGLYTSITNRKPTVMSHADYTRTKPTASWLMLTNCVINLAEASYKTTAGGKFPTELYIPLMSVGAENEKVHVLLASKDPKFMATFREMQTITSESAAMAWMLRNRDRVLVQQDVKGLVRFGIDMKEKERAKLAKLVENIVPDFIIIDDGKAPNLMVALGALAGGVVLIVLGVWYMRRNSDATAADM